MPIIRRPSSRIKLLATLWVVAEVLAFAGVAHAIGFGWALLAGLATTLLGAWLLKRTGAAAMTSLRGVLQGRGDVPPRDALDGTVAAVAAAALILPGFLSDALGLTLAIPAVRRRVARWVRGGGLGERVAKSTGRPGPRTIDLDRDEWSSGRPGDEGVGRLR